MKDLKYFKVSSFILFISFCSYVCMGQNNLSKNAEPEIIKWLQKNAVPIKSASPKVTEDLSFLSEFAGDADLILLGEGTHGTKEFYQIRDKIGRYLIDKEDFRNFGIEYDMATALSIQKYIQTGQGDVENALNEQRSWVWNTEEVLETVRWLRKYNGTNEAKVDYFGIDMLRIIPPLIHSLSFLKTHDISEAKKIEAKIESLTGKAFLEFQTNSNDFYDKFSGDVPLENNYKLKELMLLMVDLFDLNKKKIIRQTSFEEWKLNKRIAVTSLQKSKHLLQWNMNNIFPTFGRKKQNEIYARAKTTSDNLRRFYRNNDSVQLKKLEPILALIENPYRGNRKYKKLSIEQRGVLKETLFSSIERLEIRRDIYLEKSDENRLINIKKDLSLILKIFEIYKDYLSKPALSTNEREIGLAENVAWLHKKNNNKTIIWAHNKHVSKNRNAETDMMGTLLKKKYKDELLVIGTTFNKGKFQASYSLRQTNANTSRLREFEVGEAKKGSLEYMMAKVGEPIFLIDFRKIPKSGKVKEWFSKKHYVRSIGNSFNPEKPDNYYEFIEIPKHYDAMIFINEGTRATPTKFVRQKFRLN